MEAVVIVGSGQAALHAATALRSLNFPGELIIIGREKGVPYQRPPLSKAVLMGRANPFNLALQPPLFFSNHGIKLYDDKCVVGIDRDDQAVELTCGTRFHYNHLILATGARNRTLPWASIHIGGLLYLRTKEDASELRRRIDRASDIVIVGAGVLGLECAAAAAGQGRTISVVEMGTRSMGRVASEPVAEHFTRKHSARGVSFLFDDAIASLLIRNKQVTGVRTASGKEVPADLVLVAVGVKANTELASQAGLRVGNGIVVDSALRTEDRAIYAIGDCAAFPMDDELVRLESVQNAMDQGKFVAETIAGKIASYESVPIFWSEQCGSRLQIAGLSRHSDRLIVRGDPSSDAFSVFHFRSSMLLCVESVNVPSHHVIARKLLRVKIRLRPEEAADTSFDLRKLIPAT